MKKMNELINKFRTVLSLFKKIPNSASTYYDNENDSKNNNNNNDNNGVFAKSVSKLLYPRISHFFRKKFIFGFSRINHFHVFGQMSNFENRKWTSYPRND